MVKFFSRENKSTHRRKKVDGKSSVTFLLCDPGSYVQRTWCPREDQCEWHRMTRMTGPDCVVMCNLINTHTHTHTRGYVQLNKYTHTHIHGEHKEL